MAARSGFPGSERMRALLAAVAAHYADDPRLRAVALFGSLGRGDWDDYSDADLDVVVADGVTLDVPTEVAALCRALEAAAGERAVLVVPGPLPDAADVVLASLLEFSIRFHPLEATSPNITDSLMVLAGTLGAEEIIAAGEANRTEGGPPHEMLAACLRYALEAENAIRRGELWGALDLLHRARTLLFDLYAATHAGAARLHHLRRDAPDSPLTAWLAPTVAAGLDLAALRAAHAALLAALERHLPALTDGRLALTPAQRALLAAIRARGDG